jgi:hypothetical protein
MNKNESARERRKTKQPTGVGGRREIPRSREMKAGHEVS